MQYSHTAQRIYMILVSSPMLSLEGLNSIAGSGNGSFMHLVDSESSTLFYGQCTKTGYLLKFNYSPDRK